MTEDYKPGNKFAFGAGAAGDQVTYFSFTFLIFTFYFSVVGVDVNLVTIAFLIWSVWNAINDPLLGLLSDKTKTQWGRRTPFIKLGFIPLSLMMIFLWTPVGNPFFYLLVVIIIFDMIFTMTSLNLTALFPEMWLQKAERNSANNIRQIFTVIGLIVAFLVPTALISDLEASTSLGEYQMAGVVLCIMSAMLYFIAIKWGVRERVEFSNDSQSVPSWNEAIKHTLKNREFQWFIITNTCGWYVFGLIPTIIPLYGSHVLGISNELIVGLLMATAFISGGIFVNLWKYLINRWGDLRKTWMTSQAVWLVGFIVFFFVGDVTTAFVMFFLLGIGLAGGLHLRDMVMADIIDEDEVGTGVRREGAFFGVNALIMRLSTIFVFLSINLVFNNIGWRVYVPTTTPEIILGLRFLMAIFPTAALAIGILAISRYRLTGERLKEVKRNRDDLHTEKTTRTVQ